MTGIAASLVDLARGSGGRTATQRPPLCACRYVLAATCLLPARCTGCLRSACATGDTGVATKTVMIAQVIAGRSEGM